MASKVLQTVAACESALPPLFRATHKALDLLTAAEDAADSKAKPSASKSKSKSKADAEEEEEDGKKKKLDVTVAVAARANRAIADAVARALRSNFETSLPLLLRYVFLTACAVCFWLFTAHSCFSGLQDCACGFSRRQSVVAAARASVGADRRRRFGTQTQCAARACGVGAHPPAPLHLPIHGQCPRRHRSVCHLFLFPCLLGFLSFFVVVLSLL